MWAAKHCSILLSSGLGVFCRVAYRIFPRESLTVYFLQPVSAETCSWSEREEYLAKSVAEKWKIYHYVSLKVRLHVYLVNIKTWYCPFLTVTNFYILIERYPEAYSAIKGSECDQF